MARIDYQALGLMWSLLRPLELLSFLVADNALSFAGHSLLSPVPLLIGNQWLTRIQSSRLVLCYWRTCRAVWTVNEIKAIGLIAAGGIASRTRCSFR